MTEPFQYTSSQIRQWLELDKHLTQYVQRVEHSPDGTLTVTMHGSKPVPFHKLAAAASYIQLAIQARQYCEDEEVQNV